MILNMEHLPRVIPVGVQTEAGVEAIGFDVSPWLTRWPGMILNVWTTRPGESAAYIAADTEMVGNVLYWYPNGTDTEKEGAGTVEVVGVADGKRKTTGPIDTLVKKTSLDVTQETPEPIVPWFEALQKTGGIAQKGAADAAASAKEAAEKATEAGQYSTNADAQAQAAAAAAKSAEAIKDRAEELMGPAGRVFVTSVQTVNGKRTADRTPKEIKDAASDGKVCLLVIENKALYYVGDDRSGNPYFQSAYQPATFPSSKSFGIWIEIATVLSDSTVDYGVTTPASTPNPYALTIGGKKYNGSEEVSVEIPDVLIVKKIINEEGYICADKTPEEIEAAAASGKACIMVRDNKLYTYIGVTKNQADSQYGECHTFAGIYSEQGVIRWACQYVSADGRIQGISNTAKTPNPYKLTIGGQAYDGSKAVAVEIPTVPEDAGKLYIVTVTPTSTGWVSDRSREEIDAAQEAGKACLMHFPDTGEVMTYFGSYRFAQNMYLNGVSAPGLYFEWAVVNADKTVDKYGGGPLTTPNPNALTFTGAVNGTYDGSKPVQVEIPKGGGGGLPETAEPNSQLVTDADGKVMWAPREGGEVVILEETEMFPAEGGGFALLSPPSGTLVIGGVYAVTFNGTVYDCKTLVVEENGITAMAMGNADAMGIPGVSGGNPEAPFFLMLMPGGMDMGGAMLYGLLYALDDSASATISITQDGGGGAAAKGVEVFTVNVTIDSETATNPTILSCDKTVAQVDAAIGAGKICTAVVSTQYGSYHLQLAEDRYQFGAMGRTSYIAFAAVIQQVDGYVRRLALWMFANGETEFVNSYGKFV